MGGSCTSMYTDTATMSFMWALGTPTSVAGAVGTTAHTKVGIGSLTALSERLVAVLQMNDTTNRVRMFVFRKCKLASAGELKLAGNEVSGVELTLNFLPDPSITDGSDFGMVFETTANVT